jgi:hypothetical protein
MKGTQNSTDSTLSPQQAAVITSLVGGDTVSDATKKANVDRTTFYVWLKSDAHFQAELNRQKIERRDAMRSQLRALADTAIATVQEMLTGNEIPPAVRLKAALNVLATIGALDPETPGKTDPETIERDFVLDQLFQ